MKEKEETMNNLDDNTAGRDHFHSKSDTFFDKL